MRLQSASAEYLLHGGTDCRGYEYLGCHRLPDGYVFRVWAPNATRVFAVGDFCDWQEGIPMYQVTDGGIWECSAVGDRIQNGGIYKFRIVNSDRTVYKADPFAFASQCPPDTASVVCDLGEYKWRDEGWFAYRSGKAGKSCGEPFNAYEIHLPTWRRRDDGSAMNYRDIARELAPYVKQMGYTHVQLLPIWESCDKDGRGYEASSYFAPSARLGSPNDFMAFVDSMHEAGIGVLLDWTPTGVGRSESALCDFDGQPLYEKTDGSSDGEFDLDRREVRSFLLSNACFWLDRYHIDGLCIGDVGAESAGFKRELAECLRREYSDVLLISRSATDGCELFDMCFDGDWAADAFERAETAPEFRSYHIDKQRASFNTAPSGKYVLPLSHDRLTCGNKTFLDKMSGDYWQKFASTRAFLGYMMTFPGKKLTFMGSEIGQFKEWDGESPVEWFLLDYDSHAELQRYVSDLGQLYLRTPALWQADSLRDGFSWLEPDKNHKEQGIVSYCRSDSNGEEVIIVINFTPVAYENYRLGVPCGGEYREMFNSDDGRYGGSGVVNASALPSETRSSDCQENSIVMRVPPLAVSILKCVRRTQSKRKTSIASKTK